MKGSGAPESDLRRAALGARRLYLCTPDRADLEAFVEACIRGGVDVVQLREKHLPEPALVPRARLVARVCKAYGVPFVLNDRPDLAVEAGADGVHVGQDDMAVAEARPLVGPGALVGLSTHDADQLSAALLEPVDYVSVGPVVATPTKPGRPGTGLSFVTAAGRLAAGLSPAMPFFVTGNARPDTVAEMVASGARRFVAVRWLTQAADPERAARALVEAIDSAIDAADETDALAGP